MRHTLFGHRSETPRINHYHHDILVLMIRFGNQLLLRIVQGRTILVDFKGGDLLAVDDAHLVQSGVHAQGEIIGQESIAFEDGGVEGGSAVDMHTLRQQRDKSH